MVEGIHNIIPSAKIGHVGVYRDEETLEPHEYFAKFPTDIKESAVLIVDPMLATGGSASAAIEIVKRRGATDIRFVGLVGCPEGVKRLQADHPDVDIYLAAMDEKLNEKGHRHAHRRPNGLYARPVYVGPRRSRRTLRDPRRHCGLSCHARARRAGDPG
ncbi:MAG: uracil phosphoribosyltransferase [Novosphingobium sp. 32-60-15]|nr:MAG: uracil phosphoribosyltransferase [Novosphingobium sp. 32-60-15]